MTVALSCLEIKQIYDTLDSETAAVYQQLLPIDSKIELEYIESLIVEVQRKYFALLSDTGNEELENTYIRAFNPDLVKGYRKDTNGFWKVENEDGGWILYHPITKERVEEFKGIYYYDTNGFWSVKKKDGGWILYHPITKERSEEFKYIGQCDTNGFWDVITMDGKQMKYNPLTKEYKE